jgi:peptidoglycan/xylan/chitin deacetylase (PgdA/CDA1 family)
VWLAAASVPAPGAPVTLSRRQLLVGAGSAAVLAACARARGSAAAPVATTGTAPAPTAAAATSSPAGTPFGAARFVKAGPSDRARVALTFHGSGDLGLSEDLLSAARRTRAPITVFAVGQWLDDNPAMADHIRAGGHELGNHTYTHPPLATVDRAGVAREITRCRDVLARLTGSGGRWFRPSGVDTPTDLMLAEAGAAGYATVVGYDVDPRDYQDPGAAAVLARTKAGLRPGAIVSLHTGHAGTVAAFEPIVDAIRATGLEPVVLSELLGPGTRS